MKFKIVNSKKFIRSSILLIGIMLTIFFNHKNIYSKVEIKYKQEYINAGDTLWQIAEKEYEENKYFKNKDIRNIVNEIETINKIENKQLKIGQKLLIPTY